MPTKELLQQIYNKLHNVYCVPTSISYMKELKLMIDNTQRERCHTFDNGMNIPDCYKFKLTDDERAEIYRQYKEVVDNANQGTEHKIGCIVMPEQIS